MSTSAFPDELAALITTAMVVGASSSNIEQTTRILHSPDGEVSVTCTKITLTFHQPCDHSHYHPPLGSTLEDTTQALLRGEWQSEYPVAPSRPVTPANSIAISIATTTSQSSSPPAYAKNTASSGLQALADGFHFDQATPEARRLRRAFKRAIPPPERWYAVTRGLCVGAVQGVTLVHALTRGVSGSVVVHYPSQDLAEAVFDLALQAGHVEVLFV